MAVLSIDLERVSEKIGARIQFRDERNSLEAATEFAFGWGLQDQEDLRWYLEDYLTYPADPAPAIAARVEKRIATAGTGLFSAIFRSSAGASKLWEAGAQQLADLRIELRTTQPRLAALPWELIREPDSQALLALSCRSFVRVHPKPSRPVAQPSVTNERIRMLLVICRPAGAGDVPFHSVASHLLRGLHAVFDSVSLLPMR